LFGAFRLLPAQRLLLEGDKTVHVGNRALDLLAALVEQAGKTVRKDELIARGWPDTTVDEASLRVHIAALRKALGDGRSGSRFIANVQGRGYVFVAPKSTSWWNGPPRCPSEAKAPAATASPFR
jgi:DNA-binding winged helix-turn-helix (wHTH) protein